MNLNYCKSTILKGICNTSCWTISWESCLDNVHLVQAFLLYIYEFKRIIANWNSKHNIKCSYWNWFIFKSTHISRFRIAFENNHTREYRWLHEHATQM